VILGLLNCSSRKLPVPAPAWLLYSASPRFSQQYQYLTRRCEVVRIVSAKYGLVAPETPLRPYDLTVGSMPGPVRTRWEVQVRSAALALCPESVLSLLADDYRGCLSGLGLPVEHLAAGGVYQTAKTLGRVGKQKRGDILVCWPVGWVLSLVAESRDGVTLEEVEQRLRRAGYAERTVGAQLFRTVRCPLHRISDGRVRNIYV
jgi:hypothetical protein